MSVSLLEALAAVGAGARGGLELRRVHGGRGLRRGHVCDVPYLLQERRELPILQLQRDAHVGVLCAERAQL